MQADEVDAQAEELIPANIREQLASTNWKERLAGTEALTQVGNRQIIFQNHSERYEKLDLY